MPKYVTARHTPVDAIQVTPSYPDGEDNDWFLEAVAKGHLMTFNMGKIVDPDQPSYVAIMRSGDRVDCGDYIVRNHASEFIKFRKHHFERMFKLHREQQEVVSKSELERLNACSDAWQEVFMMANTLAPEAIEKASNGVEGVKLAMRMLANRGRMPRTAQEIVDETNSLARQFYARLGYQTPVGYQFHESNHPTEVCMWDMACMAQEMFTDTDPRNSVIDLED